ncbi:Secreted protein acidic and rich in cysteine [Nymphon striatum]|nr:Secreted protein acidic and rich in cysteine [Nymphon striatum]
MCPVCTNVWVRDLGNYRYPVEKIGKCPTQYGKEDPRFNMNVILCAVSILILYSSVDSVSIESQTTVPENDDPVEVTTVPTKEEELVINACKDVVCGLGQQCKINKDGIGQCLCIEQCQEETDERRKVCSNYNETWQSDCEVNRMRCLCDKNDDRCSDEKFKHVHIDYYGVCAESGFSTSWTELSERHDLKPGYDQLIEEAKKDLPNKWINAVIWKFCDLDSDPSDRSVSRHELFPVRAPLLSMEHCIGSILRQL